MAPQGENPQAKVQNPPTEQQQVEGGKAAEKLQKTEVAKQESLLALSDNGDYGAGSNRLDETARAEGKKYLDQGFGRLDAMQARVS